jgi:dihydrofolate reductase
VDPSIDFAAMYKEFDTALMGRKTYEVVTAQGGHGAIPGLDVVVFSRTLPAHRGRDWSWEEAHACPQRAEANGWRRSG